MTTPPTFGRRVPAPAVAERSAPYEAEAKVVFEALCREMASLRGVDSDFKGWRRDQQLGRWLAWFASFALLMPGALCFMAHAPAAVSGALEVAGVVGGWWLRRHRKQRLNAIRDWAPDEFA